MIVRGGSDLWRWRSAVLGTLQKMTPQHHRRLRKQLLFSCLFHPRAPHAGPCPPPRASHHRRPAGRRHRAAPPTRGQNCAPRALLPIVSGSWWHQCCECRRHAAPARRTGAPSFARQQGTSRTGRAQGRCTAPPALLCLAIRPYCEDWPNIQDQASPLTGAAPYLCTSNYVVHTQLSQVVALCTLSSTFSSRDPRNASDFLVRHLCVSQHTSHLFCLMPTGPLYLIALISMSPLGSRETFFFMKKLEMVKCREVGG